MTCFKHSWAAPLLCLSTIAHADVVFDDDVIVNSGLLGRICIGQNCIDGEVFPSGDFDGVVKLNAQNMVIDFDDSSAPGFPDRDWRIQANETGVAGSEAFFVRNVTNGTNPFYIKGDAWPNTLVLASERRVGIGTQFPDFNLHMVGTVASVITFETISAGPHKWNLGANPTSILFQDATGGTTPFEIERNAPTNSFFISADGNIGLGTDVPQAPLELSGTESFNFFRITATGAAVNDSVDITFTGGPLGTGQLRYNIVDGDAQEMSLDADGNMVIDGTLTTAGPTCAAGCDRVFDAEYAIASIEDRAAQMHAAGYLPAIGPTQPGQPVNVTEKLAGVINELEHAHIYIGQLHASAESDRQKIATLEARLDALEAQ